MGGVYSCLQPAQEVALEDVESLDIGEDGLNLFTVKELCVESTLLLETLEEGRWGDGGGGYSGEVGRWGYIEHMDLLVNLCCY